MQKVGPGSYNLGDTIQMLPQKLQEKRRHSLDMDPKAMKMIELIELKKK
jgi:hypothetical protein